jgi:hypothetical protein
MNDIFDNKILCGKCNIQMEPINIQKNGVVLRAVLCPKCGAKIIHPKDEQEYNGFVNLRNKEFNVKMRFVGNSYAVSIPREIVNFIKEQEKIMDDMVRLCLEDFGRVRIEFGNGNHNVKNNHFQDNNHVNKVKG